MRIFDEEGLVAPLEVLEDKLETLTPPSWMTSARNDIQRLSGCLEGLDRRNKSGWKLTPEQYNSHRVKLEVLWLQAGKKILVPYPAERMKAWPISSRVNSPKNVDADIVASIELESVSQSENSPLLL